MGKSSSAAEFSQKIVKMATITQRRQAQIVEQGALTAKTIIIAEAAAKGVTPSSKIAGGKWGVGYDVKGFNNPTALVRIRGPFHLIDRPTKSHFIAPKGYKGSRSRRSKKAQSAALVGAFGLSASGAFGKRTGKGAGSLVIGGEHYAYARHPGTKGKGIFDAAKAKAEIVVPRVMAKSVISGWGQALR